MPSGDRMLKLNKSTIARKGGKKTTSVNDFNAVVGNVLLESFQETQMYMTNEAQFLLQV